MEFENLVFRSEMIERENEIRVRESMIGSAYTAWLGGAGGKQTFSQFCRNLGLTKQDKAGKMTPDKKKALEANALKTANRILMMDKGKQKPAARPVPKAKRS